MHFVQDAERVAHWLDVLLATAAAEAKILARAHEETANVADGRFVGDRWAGNHCRTEHVELLLEHRRRRHYSWHVQRPLVFLVFGYRLQGGAWYTAVQQRVRAVRGQAVRRLVPVLCHFLNAELQAGQSNRFVAAALQRSCDYGALQLFRKQ